MVLSSELTEIKLNTIVNLTELLIDRQHSPFSSFLIACCPASVRLSVNFSRTTGPNFTKPGTKHPYGILIVNKGRNPF